MSPAATAVRGTIDDAMDVDTLPEDYGRFLIHGPQGAGKTRLSSTIAQLGKTLFIDTTGERGVRSFKGAPWARNIEVKRPRSITEFDDYFWLLDSGKHDFACVVVDSLTGIQKMAMRFMLGHSETAVREIRQGTAPADQRTWGQTLDIMVDTATFWYGLADGNRQHPMHVVMTAQTTYETDDKGYIIGRSPDVQRGAKSITLASPDYIMYVEEEGDLNYDSDGQEGVRHIARFGAHPGYRTKARVPFHLEGRMPRVIGRAPLDPKHPEKGYKSPDLAQLSKVLGIGGTAAPSTPVAAAADTNEKENSK